MPRPRLPAWLKGSVALLCGYVFLKEMKPGEDYLTPYLLHEKGFTEQQSYDQIYPVWTYSAAALCLIAFLFTDLVGYKNVILIEALAYLTTRGLILWGTSLFSMQVMQFVYAVATSTELGYFAYVYCISPVGQYQQVTSAVKSAALSGKLVAGVVGQITVSIDGHASYTSLMIVSAVSVAMACVAAVLLKPQQRKSAAVATLAVQQVPSSPTYEAIQRSMLTKQSWSKFWRFFCNKRTLPWVLWSAAGVCGLYQVENFIQNLWDEVSHGKSEWNAGASVAATVLGVAAAATPSVIQGTQRWSSEHYRGMLGLLSLLCGAVLMVMASTSSRLVAYGGYVVFKAMVTFTSTIASAQIAVLLTDTFPKSRNSFGMVYGFNVLAALGLESLLQLAVGEHGFALDIRSQFWAYGAFFGVLGVFYLSLLLSCCCGTGQQQRRDRDTGPQDKGTAYIALP